MISRDKFFEGVAGYKMLAKKEVGQNFLIDDKVAERIVASLDAKENDKVLEIGCGAGSLSYFLAQGPAHSTLIDIDEGLLAKVSNDFQDSEFVEIKNANAMRFDYEPFDLIIGNLPYYITSGIIEQVLLKASHARRCVFMVQKEAAARILANPRTKDYSPLSIYLTLSGKTTKLFNVLPASFVPAPHVDSTVLCIDFDAGHNEEAMKTYKLCKSLFLQRRKTILNNFKTLIHDENRVKKILDEAGIKYTARPEEIEPLQYLALTRAELRVE